jgi:hypothetical protein
LLGCFLVHRRWIFGNMPRKENSAGRTGIQITITSEFRK